MIYRQQIEIPSYLCDEYDKLHPWAAVRLCQEVTEYHGNATGIGFHVLLAQNRAWIITRALYEFYRLPDAFEKIEFSTWSRGHNGLIANRDYRVVDSDGRVVLAGTSNWPMIDMSTRHVLRLNEIIAGYESHDIKATAHDKLAKIKLPDMSHPNHEMHREACYGMIDHTRHVNNSEYIRLLFDLLHEADFDTSSPFCLEIDYLQEARLGDMLSARCVYDAGNPVVQIATERGTSVAAKVSHI